MRLTKYLMLFAFACSFAFNASAYDFQGTRIQLKQDLDLVRGNRDKTNVAVIYNNRNRDAIKGKFNLVNLKRDLSFELLKSFQVADPIVIHQMAKQNFVSYQTLNAEPAAINLFATKAAADQLILVDLQEQQGQLVVDLVLVGKDGERISHQTTEFSPSEGLMAEKANAPMEKQSAVRTGQMAEPKPQVLANFSQDFIPQPFLSGQNDSWVYYNPTALMNPYDGNIEISAWLKNLGSTDVRSHRMRFDYKFSEVLMWNVTGNATETSAAHSIYSSLKYQLFDENVAALAIGYKRRLFWNSDNVEFRQGALTSDADLKEQDEINDKTNKSTLQAMFTGRLDQFGVMYNAYLDNQQAGFGGKFLLTPEIKILAETYMNYYDKAYLDSDAVVGIQFFNPIGSVATLAYEMESEKSILTLGFAW